MSNAMRMGKRTLAGVAAGALAAGSLAFIGASSAQAATYGISLVYPSLSVVQTADDTIAIPIVTTVDGIKSSPSGTTITLTITDKDGASAGGASPQLGSKWGLSTATPTTTSGLGSFFLGWGDVSDDSTYAGIAAGTYTLTATWTQNSTGVALASTSLPIGLVSAANAGTITGTAAFVDSAAVDADPATSPLRVATDDSVNDYDPFYVRFLNSAGGPIVAPATQFAGTVTPTDQHNSADDTMVATGIYGVPGVMSYAAYSDAAKFSSTAGTGKITATFASPINQISGELATAVTAAATMSDFDIAATPSAKYTLYPGMTADDSIAVPATNGIEFTVSGIMKTGSPAAATAGVNVTFTPAGYDDSNTNTATAFSSITPATATTVQSDANGAVSQKFTVTNPVAGKGVRVTATYAGSASPDVFYVAFVTPTQTDLTPNVANLTAKNSGDVTVGAVVTDNFGDPVANLPVQVTVTGVAATSAPQPVVTTNASGEVSYTLTVPAGTPSGATSTVAFGAWNGTGYAGSGALYGTTSITYTSGDVEVASLTATGSFNVAATSYTTLTGGKLNAATNPLYINTQMNTSAIPVSAQNFYTWGLKVVAKNAAGTVLAGAPVTLSAAEGGWSVKLGVAVTSQTVYTDSNGVAEFDLTATKTGEIDWTATSGSASSTVAATYANRPTDARYVTASAVDAKVNAGSGTTLHVDVTDRFGNPVGGVPVAISENGPGYIPGSGTGTTSASGSAEFTFVSVADQTGTAVITGSVSTGKVTVSMPTIAPSSTAQVTDDTSIALQVGNLVDSVTSWTVGTFTAGGTATSSTATVTGVTAGQATSPTSVEVVPGGAAKTIQITGERTTVKGKPGVMVDGLTTGFETGAKMVPHIKFPGQTSYSEGTSRPQVDADGEFGWQRKTGKKIYIYFSNEDGDVRSDRIIIQAK